MGTSKGYISPTSIPWQKAKRAVTSYIKELSSDAKMSRAVSNYATAKLADANNYQVVSKGITGIARAINAANSGNLNDYLSQIHREDLVGKSAEELLTSLLIQDGATGSAPEEQLLMDTLPQVLENLSIVNPEDLYDLTATDFLTEFLGEYICNDFDRCFDEQIRRHILPSDYDRIIMGIHGYIKNTIYEIKDKLAKSITDFGKLANNSIVTTCVEDAFRVFSDLYTSEV